MLTAEPVNWFGSGLVWFPFGLVWFWFGLVLVWFGLVAWLCLVWFWFGLVCRNLFSAGSSPKM